MTHTTLRLNFLNSCLALTVLLVAWNVPSQSFAQQNQKTVDLKDLRIGEVDWYGVYLSGQKMGYASFRYVKGTQNGQPVITFRDQMYLRAQMQGQAVEQTFISTLDFNDKPPYRMVGGTNITRDETGEIKIVAQVVGNTLDATIFSDGQQRKSSLKNFEYFLANTMFPVKLMESKAGESFKTSEVDISELSMDEITYEIKKVANSTVSGVPVKLFTLEANSKQLGKVGDYQCDENNKMFSASIGGGAFEMRLESETDAKNLGYAVDLFDQGVLKLDKAIGAPENLASLEVLINEKVASAVAVGPYQNLEKRGNDYVLLLGERYGKKISATDLEIAENLKATTEFPIQHPTIIGLTRQAIGQETDPKRKVERLIKFVSEYVDDSLTSNALTVLAVCKNKKGDCTEHALLFTTMARAAGIPCRTVGGFVYAGDDLKVFSGHAWNEVVIDGHWQPVDSSWEEFKINPTHIQVRKDRELEFLALGMDGKLLDVKRK